MLCRFFLGLLLTAHVFHHMQMKKKSFLGQTHSAHVHAKAWGLEGELHFHVKTIHKNVFEPLKT